MKSVRQKRIEEDNNKEWAQVRYSKLEHSDRSLPNFDNTQYWNDLNESSTWITNGTRGVALPDPYYNGYKVSDEYTTPIDDLLIYIGFMKAITIQMSKLSSGLIIGLPAGVSTAELFKRLQSIYLFLLKEGFGDLMKGALAGELPWSVPISAIKTVLKDIAISIAPSVMVFSAMWLLSMGLLAGNTYKDIYDAWNSFEQDSINAQHKVDTEVDEDGNPLWSGYTVKYSIDYGNTTTTQSSSMKLFKHHQLKRGRYQSKAYSKSNVVYTFNYTKSITYIPA